MALSGFPYAAASSPSPLRKTFFADETRTRRTPPGAAWTARGGTCRGPECRCRYVHPARREAYEEACEGYRRFMALAEAYADIVIARTEREIARIKAEDGRTKKARAARGRAG